jgi:hypothetical protein
MLGTACHVVPIFVPPMFPKHPKNQKKSKKYYCTYFRDYYYPPNLYGDYYCLSFQGLLLPPISGIIPPPLWEVYLLLGYQCKPVLD